MMSSKSLYDKVFAIFGTVMVFFYFGLGFFIIFSPLITMDKALKVIFGIPLIIYGMYRTIDSYGKIKNCFFTKDTDE
jgi:cytochrome c biogenesis protein CcdA